MEKQAEFRINQQSGSARAGILQVGRRRAATPLLVQTGPVTATLTAGELTSLGTVAIKQSALPYWLAASQASQPQFGDLHDYLHWPGLLIGDSGAEQAYQWAKPRGRKKSGVSFHDPATGQQKLYTPALAREWQQKLGCDLQLAFARWENYYSPVDDLQSAAEQSAGWLTTSVPAPNELAAIVGGGLKAVRQSSVTAATKATVFGYAVAGVDPAVKLAEQVRLVQEVVRMLPAAGLRYLPTVGSLEQVFLTLASGVDMVDCDCAGVAALHGVAFDRTRRLHLGKDHLVADHRPLVSGCTCPTCAGGYSRAYLHQLLANQHPLGVRLLLIHNLFVLNHLLLELRQAIQADQVDDYLASLSIG